MLTKNTILLNEKYEMSINTFHDTNGNHIFNESRYFLLHKNSNSDVYAQLLRSTDKKVFATISFYEAEPKIYSSPAKGTFGGVSCNNPVEINILEIFIKHLLNYMKLNGAIKINILLPPLIHNLPFNSIILNILIRLGFVIKNHELGYIMEVDKISFIEKISYGSQKKIKQCIRDGFLATQEKHINITKIYSVIKESRERLGIKVSLTLNELNQMISIFPDKFHLFSISKAANLDQTYAAAVCIALTDKILYVFYWGDINNKSTYSPIVLLAQYIYTFCQNNGFNYLDAGVSTLQGEPNYGLMQFKKNLGFMESIKIDLALDLN